jgi:uncharacterized coiled-coil DUF342 family protein
VESGKLLRANEALAEARAAADERDGLQRELAAQRREAAAAAAARDEALQEARELRVRGRAGGPAGLGGV